jgi:hypothetical protein
MAESPLIAFPPELRLAVYRELILTCLVEDTPSEIQGLFLSCRQIYQEMENEYISKARAFVDVRYICKLSTKLQWETPTQSYVLMREALEIFSHTSSRNGTSYTAKHLQRPQVTSDQRRLCALRNSSTTHDTQD